MLDLVATDGSDCPTFFFIDPFGFKSLDYDVISRIGSTPQFELLITFMSRDMNRFLEVEDHQEALTTVFGTPNWRTDLRSSVPTTGNRSWSSIRSNWKPMALARPSST